MATNLRCTCCSLVLYKECTNVWRAALTLTLHCTARHKKRCTHQPAGRRGYVALHSLGCQASNKEFVLSSARLPHFPGHSRIKGNLPCRYICWSSPQAAAPCCSYCFLLKPHLRIEIYIMTEYQFHRCPEVMISWEHRCQLTIAVMLEHFFIFLVPALTQIFCTKSWLKKERKKN